MIRPVLIFALLYLIAKDNTAKHSPPCVKYVDWLPSPRRAMTIPPFGIYILKKYQGNDVMLQHEFRHWKQYQNMGLLQFYMGYFSQYMKYGYTSMPMELECGPRV